MIVVILAAGKGVRLVPFTLHEPKPLLSFNGISLLEMLLKQLPDCRKIIVVIDYLGEKIIKELHRLNLKNVVFKWQAPNLKGTMGALLSVANEIDEDFLVICSDNIYRKSDLIKLVKIPNSYLALRVSADEKFIKFPCAKLSILTENNSNKEFFLDLGAWFLPRLFLKTSPVKIENEELSIPHTMKSLDDNGTVCYNYIIAKEWIPIGNPKELKLAEIYLGCKSNFNKYDYC